MAEPKDLQVFLEDFARLSRYTGFQYFRVMTDALSADTRRFQSECIKIKQQLDGKPLTQEGYAELGFWYRGHARALLTFVEGLLYVMRQLISHAEERGEIQLDRGESHLIREKEYFIQSDKIQERPKFSQLTDTIRLTLRLFPQVFGSTYQVNYNDNGWAQFQRLVKMRNDLTHPKSAKASMLQPELANTIRDAAVWFFGCVSGILSKVDGPLMEQSHRDTIAMPEAQELVREQGKLFGGG